MITTIVGTNQLGWIMCGGNFFGRIGYSYSYYLSPGSTPKKLHQHFKECPERSILDFRFELAFQIILNELPGRISNPEDLIKSKRSGEDCGHEWVSTPKFCGKWVGTGWR